MPIGTPGLGSAREPQVQKAGGSWEAMAGREDPLGTPASEPHPQVWDKRAVDPGPRYSLEASRRRRAPLQCRLWEKERGAGRTGTLLPPRTPGGPGPPAP